MMITEQNGNILNVFSWPWNGGRPQTNH